MLAGRKRVAPTERFLEEFRRSRSARWLTACSTVWPGFKAIPASGAVAKFIAMKISPQAMSTTEIRTKAAAFERADSRSIGGKAAGDVTFS
jgi:hypothetical protein